MRSQYPLVPVLSRYVTAQFVSIFVPVLAAFVLLYLIIDLFDRLDVLLRHEATVSASARYFLFKIPLMITQITPPAVITAVLLAFGILSRHNEVVAMRAGGVSLLQTAVPILLITCGISVLALIWNEMVVPYSSRQFQYVNNVEIRKRQPQSVLSEREIWYHGADGFYNIDYVDRANQRIYGLLIYRLDKEFRLQSVVEVPRADWRPGGWKARGAVLHQIDAGESTVVRLRADELTISETLEDFLEVERRPEELSFPVLRDRINDLTRKGIDASHDLVALHLKLALPFANVVLGLVAIPIGGRLRRHPSIARIVGMGIAVGFAYWVVLGLANSLGQSGALPAIVAAWSANAVYLLFAAALFLSAD
jgi:lipopolysaccharide export system permease protein